ncbi:MAG TPA: TRAP transporter small permease [Microvirga sp.]|jgi:TRAP-type C4-dicarboxylate transport system permease small subunit|nr:TRAP transporter small permease [Microvirga sp.]
MMRAFTRAVGGLVRLADHLIGLLLLVTVAVNAAAVFMRYVVGDSISWSEEAIRYLAIWITFLGAVAASQADEHMDMNMLAEFGGAGFQRWHRSLLHILISVFAAIVTWQGVRYCILNGAQTAPTTGLPMVFVYSALAVGGALLFLVSIAKIFGLQTSAMDTVSVPAVPGPAGTEPAALQAVPLSSTAEPAP